MGEQDTAGTPPQESRPRRGRLSRVLRQETPHPTNPHRPGDLGSFPSAVLRNADGNLPRVPLSRPSQWTPAFTPPADQSGCSACPLSWLTACRALPQLAAFARGLRSQPRLPEARGLSLAAACHPSVPECAKGRARVSPKAHSGSPLSVLECVIGHAFVSGWFAMCRATGLARAVLYEPGLASRPGSAPV